jgi:hypothetical protein
LISLVGRSASTSPRRCKVLRTSGSAGSIMRITNEADENGMEQCLSRWTGRVCSLRRAAIAAAGTRTARSAGVRTNLRVGTGVPVRRGGLVDERCLRFRQGDDARWTSAMVFSPAWINLPISKVGEPAPLQTIDRCHLFMAEAALLQEPYL